MLAAIGGREQPGRSPIETIQGVLAGRTALLVMDNCEHVVAAAANVASDLLSGSPTLSILATSREQLGVAGEVTFTVPSLSIDTEALELFVDRAARARPGFARTAENAAAIGEICQRLDGMPLALELAAARIRALSPQQICDGLSDRFRLLSTGARTLMPRQQTLRGSVDWSYDLLSDDERAALRRLSVFSGGFDLDAAQVVVADDRIDATDVTDLVGSLVDKSLVIVEDRSGLVRYRMLETIREYGAERLDEAGERSDVARRHRSHFRTLLEHASAEEEGPNQAEWRARVIVEMDNIRAALNSALADGDGAALIALTCGAGNTWTLMGGSTEHHRWLVEALALAPDDSPFLPDAVYQLGITDQFVGDMASSHRHLGASVALYRSSGDEVGALWALAEYAFTVVFQDGLEAAAGLRGGDRAARAIGADASRASLWSTASASTWPLQGDRPKRAINSRPRSLSRRRSSIPALGDAHVGAANTTLGDLDHAEVGRTMLDRLRREAGDRMTLGMGLWVLTPCVWPKIGSPRHARATELEAVVLDLGPLNWWAWVMHGVAAVAVAEATATARSCVRGGVLRMRQASRASALYHATKAEALLDG